MWKACGLTCLWFKIYSAVAIDSLRNNYWLTYFFSVVSNNFFSVNFSFIFSSYSSNAFCVKVFIFIKESYLAVIGNSSKLFSIFEDESELMIF